MKAAYALLLLPLAGCLQMNAPFPAIDDDGVYFSSYSILPNVVSNIECDMAMPPIYRGENQTLVATTKQAYELLRRAAAVFEYLDGRPDCSTPYYFLLLDNGTVAEVNAAGVVFHPAGWIGDNFPAEPTADGTLLVQNLQTITLRPGQSVSIKSPACVPLNGGVCVSQEGETMRYANHGHWDVILQA